MSANLQEYISQHIDFYTTKEVQTRGLQLFKEGKVTLNLYKKELDTYIFTVKGSQNYKVHIRDLSKRSLNTSCTCPFIWGSVCKHVVGALTYLNQGDFGEDGLPSLQMAPAAIPIPENKRGEHGYLLQGYEYITEDLVLKNSGTHIFNEIRYLVGVTTLKLEKASRHLIVFKYKLRGQQVFVYFRNINNQCFVSSSNTPRPNTLNGAETLVLWKISQSMMKDTLDHLFQEKHLEHARKLLPTFGLSENARLEDYFTLEFHQEDGPSYFFNQNAIGLLPVNGNSSPRFTTMLDVLNMNPLDDIELQNIYDIQREIGFVVDVRERQSEWNDTPVFNVTPIVGKANKAKTQISSNIAQLDETDYERHLSLSENTRELLKLLGDEDRLSTEQEQLGWTRAVIDLLIKEPFVYKNTSTTYSIRKSSLSPIEFSAQPIEAFFVIDEDTHFTNIKLKIKHDEKVYQPEAISERISNHMVYNLNGKYCTVKDVKMSHLINQYAHPYKMVKEHKQKLFDHFILPLSEHIDIDFTDGVYDVEQVELDFRKKQVYLSEMDNYLVITPRVEYHHGVSVDAARLGSVLVEHNNKYIQYRRNSELEEEFIDYLSTLHPNFKLQKPDKVFHLHFETFMDGMWFYAFFDSLQNENIEVFGLENLKKFKYSPHKGEISTSVSSGIDWFEIKIDVKFGDNTVSLNDLRKAVANKQRYIQLKDGSVGILPAEWFERFEKYFRHGEVNNNTLEVSKLRFSIIDDLFENISDAEVMQELAEKRSRLAAFTSIKDTKVPATITANLRHYQKEGLNWLNFLDEMRWGGILADDMGLGKTLQVLTFLQHILERDKTPNLVIVPTTLLFNWENEIKKFAPKLKALYHYGTGRARDTKEFHKYHLVFTSYGVLLRDVKMMSEFRFNYIILDESQAIKNPASRRYKAACALQANNRLAMTGTPIENSTFDLFAQMSFVNRGFLGHISTFKDHFSNAIDKEGNDARAEELQKLINPFVLRRTKEKVATELPDKTEDIIWCEMDTAQRRVYDSYLQNYRNEIITKIETEGIGKSKMMVLEALTRLRQICDSPVLVGGKNAETSESVKIDELVQHITDRTAKHKILIFSQFVKMLGLLKDELSRRKIKFEYLDGQCTTQQRERSVSNFQEDQELRVFLISLKAGGTGLNLTAADYVYIVDPWWNPAVENQAIDRCYRIGQDKKVFAYRMICKNTVEEKILKLQERKKRIAGDIIQTDENMMKNLTMDDIRDLFD